jgi:lipopolysaccharide export system ATP-binding protein
MSKNEQSRSKVKILRAEKISKSYKTRKVVSKVDLQVSQGEIVGLLGPNGAGKTTTFYMIVGLVSVDKGKIVFDNEIISELTLDQRAQIGIAYLPQEASIFRELTVEENILSVLELKRLGKSEQQERCNELIKEFDIERIRKSKGRELSGGERRRVEIARTMALSPHFILLDEPFAGVDPLAVGDLQQIIKHLKKQGIGVLITDHNVRETLGIVDRAYIMSAGELLVEGTPQDIVTNEVARKFYLGEEFTI